MNNVVGKQKQSKKVKEKRPGTPGRFFIIAG